MSLSQWHQATYNAIRVAGGNFNTIVVNPAGGGTPANLGTSGGLTPSVYGAMTNVIWALHQYPNLYGGQTGVVTQLSIQLQMSALISTCQQIKSADGVMPVLAEMCSDSTQGSSIDTSGQATINAVVANIGPFTTVTVPPTPPTPPPPTPPPPTPPPPTPPPPTPPPTTGGRVWWQVPGGDRTILTCPQQTTATFTTSGAAVNAVRGVSNASVLQSYFIPPMWISRSTNDPLCTFIDPTGTIPSFQMHVPAGAYSESFTTPGGSTVGDNSAAFMDTSIPYKYVAINGCYIGSSQANASAYNQVSSTNKVIVAITGISIEDATGPMLMDAITKVTTPTSWQNSNNVVGRLTDHDLTMCNADPNYVIQHATCLNLGTDVFTRTAPKQVWPLTVSDSNGTGVVPEGTIWMIPASTPRPPGQTRGFYAMFDLCRVQGMIFNNVTQAGTLHVSAINISSANQALLADMSAQFKKVVQYLCMLNYQAGVAGAQYSLATLKGRLANATGWSDAFPAPPMLDYSPTGGVSVKPSTFGAWSGAHGIGLAYDVNWGASITPAIAITPAATAVIGGLVGAAFWSYSNLGTSGGKLVNPGTPPTVTSPYGAAVAALCNVHPAAVPSGAGDGSWMCGLGFGGDAQFTLSSNKEAQYYRMVGDTYKAYSIAPGGGLVITADKAVSTAPGTTSSTSLVTNRLGLQYNSGAISSCTLGNGFPATGIFSVWTIGYIEMIGLLPVGAGLWPAFWAEPISGSGPEIDVMEALGNDVFSIYCTIHDPTNIGTMQSLASNATVVSSQEVRVTVSDYSKNVHAYGCDKQANVITWYVDRIAVCSYTTPLAAKSNYYLMCNLAVGTTGSWPGPATSATQFPAKMGPLQVNVWPSFASVPALPPPTPPGTPPPVTPPPPPPPPTPPPPPPTTNESAQGTVVSSVGPVLINSVGERYSITVGEQVAVNGIVDGSTFNVVALLYYNHRVYQKAGVNASIASAQYGPDYYDWYYTTQSVNPWSGKLCDPRLPQPSSFIDITASPYNAVGDGVGGTGTDNLTKIQSAFDYAAAHNVAVFVPGHQFNYSGVLTANGITVFGTGNASILRSTDNANSALKLTGSGAFITCLRLQGTNTARLTTYQAAGIQPSLCDTYCIQNVVIDGIGCASIYSETGQYGVIQFNTVLNSWSDSITQTLGSNYCTVNGNRTYNSGDDNISNNSYNDDTLTVNNIVITNNSAILNKFARGFEISGGSNITFNKNFHVQNYLANELCNFFCATEITSFSTKSVTDCKIKNNCFVNGGTNQGAILIWGDNASNSITGLVVDNNQIINPQSNPIQLEGDATLSGSITNTTVYEVDTSQDFVYSTATDAGAMTVGTTTVHDYTTFPTGGYSVMPGGGCGTIGVPNLESSNWFIINKASAKVGYAIYDAAHNSYTLDNVGHIVVNGSVLAGSSNVVFLLYSSGAVYQMNTSKNWYGPVTAIDGGSLVADPRI